jgi:ATPases involved in chromosome partitioning
VPTLAVVPPLAMANGRGNRLLAWMHSSDKANGNGVPHSNELVTMVDARSHAAEAFRTLRTNLLFSTVVQSVRELIITSAGPSDGKSTTAANLAVAFAQQGQRVLLIDCDLRKPRIHTVFGHAQMPGLTNALLAESRSPSWCDRQASKGFRCLPPDQPHRTRRSCSAEAACGSCSTSSRRTSIC